MSGTEFARAKEDTAAIMRAKQAAGKSLHISLFALPIFILGRAVEEMGWGCDVLTRV